MPSLVESVPPPDQVPASGDSGEAAWALPARPSAMVSNPARAKGDFNMVDPPSPVDGVTTRPRSAGSFTFHRVPSDGCAPRYPTALLPIFPRWVKPNPAWYFSP